MLPHSLFSAVLLLTGAPGDDASRAAWDAWPARRFVTTAAPCLRHAELGDRLRALAARHRGRLALEEAGRSVEGRPIQLLRLGRGPRNVMLWSQMHGDEPSATPALLDVADTLLTRDPAGVLDRLTLLMVPMLNPDGAERYARRNAQAIDVNRDALVLASPEGRLLKALRDRFQPELGFNLHDQDRRTTVGDTGVLSTISLLAVAGDAQGTLTPGRARAKRVCTLLARTLPRFVPGGVARYDEDWNPRAFGDNLTAWGTPVVLIESGGVPPGLAPSDLTRLNYVALLSVLEGLARDDLAGEDPSLYESLKRNADGRFVDVLLAGGRVAQPSAPEPYAADVAFDLQDDDSTLAGCDGGAPPSPSLLREVGDGRLLASGRRVDASGRLVVPAFTASVQGRGATAWLDAAALSAIARLGVARLLWHVAPGELSGARAAAAALAGAGRPSLEVVGEDVPAAPLRVAGRPAAPADSSLAAALQALTGGRWRADGARSLPELLAGLAAAPGGRAASAPVIAPGRPASLLVLKPAPDGAHDLARLEIETVFVDGREPAAGR